MSSGSSGSRTVGGNPLAPLFNDISARLRQEGLLATQYPVELSRLPVAPTPPRAAIPVPAQAAAVGNAGAARVSTGAVAAAAGPSASRNDAHPMDFGTWCKSFGPQLRGLARAQQAENDRVEAQQAEMLRDIESGAFAHLGLVAPPRRPKQEPDA
ncbi:hypothetical protein AURDEDRAFT_142014 [Auricularia subglabra TFB-10046 SS5]|nr:hypothetical protein AURDEDRAFT_142014 [Auricularia subglabra TFB-10046 SS5]